MLALASTVDVPADPTSLADEIARTAACLDAATHRLLTCIRAFDKSGDWERQGLVSCAAWLTWRIGLDRGAAREKVRVASATTTGMASIVTEPKACDAWRGLPG
jgi:hypothetical protein